MKSYFICNISNISEEKCSNNLGYMTKWLPCPYKVNIFKTFSGTASLTILKLGIHCLGLELCKIWQNDSSRLTLTLFIDEVIFQ